MPSPVTLTRPEEAHALWIIRDRMRFMGDVAGTNLAVVEIDVPPGSGTPPHRHESIEIFRVLSGEITFGLFDGDEPQFVVGGAGSVATIPSNAAHNYQNNSAAPASLLVVVERPMIEFFHELGKEEDPPAGPPSDDEIAEVMAMCAKHGVQILGGPA